MTADQRAYGPPAELAWFSFDQQKRRFRLESAHPEDSVEEIRGQTGFKFDCPGTVPLTPTSKLEILPLIRSRIRNEIVETYPRFASTFAN